MGLSHVGVAPVNLLALILVFGLVRLVLRLAGRWYPVPETPQPKAPRPLKPKTGGDCPFCRAEELARQTDSPVNEEPLRLPPPPWRSTRSPRGRRKASRTEGEASLIGWLVSDGGEFSH